MVKFTTITVYLIVFILNVKIINSCKVSEFACRGNTLCLPLDKYCDGRDDCGDLSDEPKYCTGKKNRSVV